MIACIALLPECLSITRSGPDDSNQGLPCFEKTVRFGPDVDQRRFQEVVLGIVLSISSTVKEGR